MESKNLSVFQFVIAVFLAGLVSRSLGIAQASNGFYKAAVYEHALIFPAEIARSYDEAVQQMLLNLNEYKKQADIAGSQGVDIIVFPEDGIYGYEITNATDMENYLEYIPDPGAVDWNPCVDPFRFNRTEVQFFLSCLAMNNSLYLVANYGDVQPCLPLDSNCPDSGHYQYNTNIVFNRKGKLIARYHKQQLFSETQFNEPAKPEMITFDTEFGRFGTFTCFDILFHDPAIPLLEKFNVTDIVFPTAWIDVLPYLSAIGYHSSFAAAYNVNFLSANLHFPSKRVQGSGIYTPDGALTYFYENSPHGRLLVHDVPILSRHENKSQNTEVSSCSSALKYSMKYDFQGKVRRDTYNFVSVKSRKETVSVCQGTLCCSLSYERDNVIGNYAFGVFDGRHLQGTTYYMYLQVCIFLKCASDNNTDCGKYTYEADGYFKSFNITGNFSTPYVSPQVVRSNKGLLELPSLNSMKYRKNCLVGDAKSVPLLSTSLIGRIYDKDYDLGVTSSTVLLSTSTTGRIRDKDNDPDVASSTVKIESEAVCLAIVLIISCCNSAVKATF